MNRIIFLCCLQIICLQVPCFADAYGEKSLVVGPGEELKLEAPETGARLEAAIGGGPLEPLDGRLLAPATGDHWLAVASRDRSGNLSPVRWLRLRVDTTPPRVGLSAEPSPVKSRWMPAGSEVSAVAEDALAGVGRLFLAVGDEVREASADSLSAPLPASGDVTVRAWAIDQAGNRSAETRLELSVDAVPPSGEIRVTGPRVTGPGGEEVLAPASRISVHPSDAGSGPGSWSVRIDGEEAEASALGGPWEAGSHTVEPLLVDTVGNAAQMEPFRFTVDAAGPAITWRLRSGGAEGADGEIYYVPPVGLEAMASDEPAGLARLSGSPDGREDRPIEGTVLAYGERYVLTSTDRVGNNSREETSWRLDQMPPEIFLETETGERVAAGDTVTLDRGSAIRVRTSDLHAGVAYATYRIETRPGFFWRRWWWDRHPRPVPEEIRLHRTGQVTLVVEASDWLGNHSTASWPIDVRPAKGDSS